MTEVLEDGYEKAYSAINLFHFPSTINQADSPLQESHVIACVALCSIAQIGLLIWFILSFRLRQFGHASVEVGRSRCRNPPVNALRTSETDKDTFYYRDPTTGNLIVRLDFLVDLAHLLKNFGESLADYKQHHSE
ncbi:unnamed protein product [Hydatigera taeniaeformis]|uniref:Transmembrane protein n=1 Tax=Hydatigena taeniaeformis TaxID=6205 RepID=A0A0R3X1V0_HYDTA|nr:unnamed protein product [Hydatigera taeniaeformis]